MKTVWVKTMKAESIKYLIDRLDVERANICRQMVQLNYETGKTESAVNSEVILHANKSIKQSAVNIIELIAILSERCRADINTDLVKRYWGNMRCADE